MPRNLQRLALAVKLAELAAELLWLALAALELSERLAAAQ